MPPDALSSTFMMLAAVLVLVALTTGVVITSRTPTRVQRRLVRVARGGPVEPKVPNTPPTASVRRMPIGAATGKLGHRFSALLPLGQVVQTRMERAGIRLSVADLALISLVFVVLIFLILHNCFTLNYYVSIGVGIILAMITPTVVIGSRIRSRRRQFLAQFPDAVDLIVRGVRSGLPVIEALHTVGQEVQEPVGTLFQDISGSIKLGKSLNEALVQSSLKLDIQEMRFFSISLAIQQETGGNLGEILNNLSNLMRRREQLKLRIKAMSSEARASAMIIGSLPFIMSMIIYALDPAYITKLVVDPRGWVLLGAGVSSLTIGLAVMAKMVRFEI